MKKFFAEFKEFISKGNIMDMAVGVIIGGAFGTIVNSLVNDIIMPLISLLVGGLDFSDWKWVIVKATADTAETSLKFGNFLSAVLNFLIIALCIFTVLKIMMNAKSKLEELAHKNDEKEEEPAPEEKKETTEELLAQIRDMLSEQNKK